MFREALEKAGFNDGQIATALSVFLGEKKNASQYPEIYYCRHMIAGLAGYENETIYVGLDAIRKMCPTFQGKPVYVFHVEQVDLENIKMEAHGYVVDTFYNELDGWFWSKFIVVDDAAHKAIKDGWAVSNAYIPTEFNKGGTLNNCPYDREIMDGQFTHLAIVPNPRYESACVMSPDEYKKYCAEKKSQQELLNSKEPKKGNTMFKLFKNEKKEVSEIDAETMIEIKNDDGTTSEVSVQSMIDAVQNAKKNEDEKKEEKMNMDSEIKVGNESMTVKELANRYQKLSAKNNECEDDEKKNESEDEDEKKNESEDEDEKKNEGDEDEKKNSKSDKDKKNFEQLKNAGKNGQVVNAIETQGMQVARGNQRYG